VTTAVLSHIRLAEELARELLRPLPERLTHSAAVAGLAAEIAETVAPDERDVLIASAWLHDIGYSPAAHRTGFHPLDGAAYLLEHGWPSRIAGLVAHHSGAAFTASTSGFATDLARYADERSPVSDALTYADQHIGPHGRHMTLDQRMTDMLSRHGAGSPQARAHEQRRSHIIAAVGRVDARRSMLTA
jgi:putative nucleotidyltransferase with HDIG domain